MGQNLSRRAAIVGALAASAALAVPVGSALAKLPAHNSSHFPPMPRSRQDWERVYYHAMTDDRLAPRVCPGELLIFDPLAVPEVGSIVLVTFEIGEATDALLGILTRLSDKSLSLALGLYDRPVSFKRSSRPHTINAAVGVMTRMDTPEDRAQVALNAALRIRDRDDAERAVRK